MKLELDEKSLTSEESAWMWRLFGQHKIRLLDENEGLVIMEPPKPKYVSVDKPRQRKYSHRVIRDWNVVTQNVIEYLSQHGATKSTKLCKKMGVPVGGGTHARFTRTLKNCKDVIVDVRRGRGAQTIFRLKNQEQQPITKGGFMHKKSPYYKFMSDRIKYYLKTSGLDYLAASRAAQTDWTRGKTVPNVPFPQITGIPPENVEVFKQMLAQIAKKGGTIRFEDCAATFNIGWGVYSMLLADVIQKTDEIKTALGITSTKNFVSDGANIYWK